MQVQFERDRLLIWSYGNYEKPYPDFEIAHMDMLSLYVDGGHQLLHLLRHLQVQGLHHLHPRGHRARGGPGDDNNLDSHPHARRHPQHIKYFLQAAALHYRHCHPHSHIYTAAAGHHQQGTAADQMVAPLPHLLHECNTQIFGICAHGALQDTGLPQIGPEKGIGENLLGLLAAEIVMFILWILCKMFFFKMELISLPKYD